MRLAQVLLRTVQVCFVLLALVLVFWPSTRAPAAMQTASALAFANFMTVLWRMNRVGATSLSMTALWAGLRRDPSGAGVGLNYFDMLAIWMGFVLPFLAH